MNNRFVTTKYRLERDLTKVRDESKDVIVVSTAFDYKGKSKITSPSNSDLSERSQRLLSKAVRALKFGGLLFTYGTPRELASWGEHLSNLHDEAQEMIFKYWIALDIDNAPGNGQLKPTHLGLLMYLKSRADRKRSSAFRLNTDSVRIPHAQCAACGQALKDWGGKKHLMNPRGAALSDVWRDLPRRKIRNSIIPEDVLARVLDLTRVDGGSYLHVIQEASGNGRRANRFVREASPSIEICADKAVRVPVQPDQVLETDCVSFLEKVAASHPEGLFDLAFADPPYNLQKLYGNYDDALAEHRYIEWCNQWLDGMARTLKPGGSLFVLNLPKWAIHHAAFLNRSLEFRHWIAWDALSDPRGKLMPAHYALLYYTRPGAEPAFNYSPLGSQTNGNSEAVLPPDSPKYCLRSGCVKTRKRLGEDEKVELSDVWFDIHRIKHKRDRDAHPCQLPEKLMERIIRLTTKRGGLVFDPFCGAGTTAIAALKLGRRFVVTDVDPIYTQITREKIAAMTQNEDLFGQLIVPRAALKKRKLAASKREVELYLQSLARKLGRVPTEKEIQQDNGSMLQKIDIVYSHRGAALKRAKIVLSTGWNSGRN